MPLMSGPELAGRVAALRPEIRVLFVSGYTGSALSCHERLGPGTPLLAKPITPDGLARAVRQVLNGGG